MTEAETNGTHATLFVDADRYPVRFYPFSAWWSPAQHAETHVREYNELLRAGASDEILDAKLAEANASGRACSAARERDRVVAALKKMVAVFGKTDFWLLYDDEVEAIEEAKAAIAAVEGEQ